MRKASLFFVPNITIMKFPHLYRITNSREYREELRHCLVKKDFTIATDSHVLVKHPTKNLFDEVFIDALPVNGIALNHFILKAICLTKISSVELFGPVLILKSEDRSRYAEMSFDLPDVDYIKWPDYNKVLFTEEEALPLKRITINPVLLHKAVMAMDPEYPFLNMYFKEEMKAILIKPKIYSDYFGAVGVIMPVMPE
jgi:hypothetical protein